MIAYSQLDIKSYPTTLEYNGKLVTIFKFEQAKDIYKDIIRKDYLEVKTNLDSVHIEALEQRGYLLEAKLRQKDNIISSLQEIIIEKKDIISNNEKINLQYRKQIRRTKIRNGTIIGGIIAVALIPTIISIKN